MPATRKEEESTMGGRGGECDASGVGGRRAAGAAAVGGGAVASSGSAYPVADGEERGATSLPMLDSTVHTIYRSPSMGAWMPDSECGGSNMSRYSLLPPASVTAATASIQQMESAAAMMKLAYRNRLHDRVPLGAERRNSTPGGDVTGGNDVSSSWRMPTIAWAGAGASGAEAPAPLRGEPELPRPQGLRLPLADVCEASVARQRAPRDPSSSSDEGLGLDRQPSLTDLRSLDSESGSLAAAMPPAVGRRRPRGLHEQPLSGHRIHQSQSPPHDRLDSLRSSRQMSASSTFHGLQSLPGYTERKGAGNDDAPEGQSQPQPLRDPRHDLAGMSPPVDYQMWSNKIVELQQMSDSLTQGIANFIRIATSCDPQYKDAMPPVIPKDRHVSTSENHFSRKMLDSPSPIVTPRTLFSRTGPTVDPQRHYATANAGRDCIVPRVSCTVTPANVSVSAERYENANNFERGMVSGSPASPHCGSYVYQDQGSIRGPTRVGVGDTVDSLVTIATIPSLRGVELDANEVLKRQSAEISGDIGGYRPGVIPLARRQCTGESGDFEPSGPLVNSETTSSVEMGHCSRNCICKEDYQCAARTSNEVYANDSTTLTLFERTGNSVETCTESTVGVNLCETEENISTDIRIHDSSTTNETPDDSIGWARSVRSETAICSHTSDFVVPDTGINYTFPPSISGIDEMRSILMKERNVNRNESSVNDQCRSECNDRNVEVESEKPVADASEVKHDDGEQNLVSSIKNVSGCPPVSSRESNCEPSYDLEQHFLPSTTTSNEVRVAETDKGVSKIDNDVQNEQNELDSKSITSNSLKNNDTIENLKNEHIDCTHIGSSNPSTSSVMFKTVREEGAMENICISTCALKTLLSGHGILEDVKEMEMLSTRIPENKEKAAYLNSLRKSTSTVCRVSENEVQPNVKENGWQDALNSETCTPAERPAAEKDIYSVSNTSISVKKGDSRAGNVVGTGLYGESVTVLASQREMATSEDRSRSATPTDCRSIDAGKDDSGSGTTSASTSLFGSVIRWAGAAAGSLASASNSSSASELRAPTNSFEDVHTCSRRSSARYDARETLNLVRDLIWKDSTYTTLRPEHDVEVPSSANSKPGAGAVVAGSDKKGGSEKPAAAAAAAAEVQQRGAGRGGVRTVWQPRHHRLRHDRSSQTCVAVREFPNIPATDSLQRTVKTTNLKGSAKSPTTSPRTGPPSLAARLHQKTSPAPVRSGPAVPGGWPAVSARPLVRSSTPAGPAHGHAPAAGLSRSAGSSPRMPCSAYTREPAGRAASTAGSASARDVAGTRSKDASAADALLADAASLFRAKLDACDRKQGDQRRAQKGRPLSAAARLSGAAPAGPPNYLRMARTAASAGRRQPLQESENWHQRQQQLQQRQLQLQQRQQLLQQRQLQLQQRQQMQQRQQLLQRQTRVQQTGSWQPRLNQTQVAKPNSRRPASRAGDAANAPESAPGSASLRMLQARLRAGGSLHRGVVAVGDAATANAHAHIWPQPEGGKESADRDLEEEDEAEVETVDCPTRDGDAEAQPASRDLTRPEEAEVLPEAVQPPHTEEHNIPEAEAHDTHEVHEEEDGKRSTDNVNISQEPLEGQSQNHSAVCGTYTDTSSYLNTDFVNVEARVSDLSLLSERCNMRFMNYLPSTPIREIDEEDFFREIMFSSHKEVFKSSYDNLLLPHCANETQLSNIINPLDRENSDTEVSVQSEHLIDPPAEFCTDVKVGGEDKCVASPHSQMDVADTHGQDSCPTDSTPAPDGLEASHSYDAGFKVSCSRSSSVSSILKQYETDTSSNVARTSDLDQRAETIEMTSESDANQYTSDEENAVLSHSRGSGISSTESPSILHSERTLDNNTEGPNDVSEGKTLHKDDPMLLCCDLFSIQTKSLTLDEGNTACGSVANSCSPQHTDFQEKCGNDVISGTYGSEDSISNYISCSALPELFTFQTTVDGKEAHGSSVDSYVEQQVMYQERENGIVRNETSEKQDQNNLSAPAKPSFTPLAITSHEKMSNVATAKNDISHKPSIQESADAEMKEASTERNGGGNRATALSLGELLSPTSSSEYTDCSQTSEERVECPTEDTESRDNPKSKLHNMVQNTSASFPDEQSPSSILSSGSSLSLLNTNAANDFPINNSIETNTTIQEQCRETIPCSVNDCKPQIEPCLTQDVLIDVTQTETSMIDVDVVNVVNKISDNEENSGDIETASQDLQDDDSFRDAEDDTMSIKSLNNDDLTDASSVSDPFSAAQFFSDGDEGLSSPGFGTATSSRLSVEQSINYDDDDESFNNLCATLVSELQESFNEELNKTYVDNNASADINGKIISLGTETTSHATASRAPAPETSFTETQDAQRINVVDVVSSTTSWVTVSTSSFSGLPVEEASISSLTASTQNKVGNSEEHSESLSDNRTSIRHTAECSIYSCQLSAETNVDNNKVESTVEEIDSSFDSAKRIGDAPADEIYAVSSSESSDAENISSLVVADTQSNLKIKDEHKGCSSDSAECIQEVATHETHVTPSSELLVEAITSYLAMAGAQTILEHVEGSSDNVERIIHAAAEETYNLCFSELADEATISSIVGNGTQNKVEISEEHLESSSDNVTCVQDTASESNITTFSELPAEGMTSSLAVAGAVNILEDEETSSDNARYTRDLKEDDMYAIHSSALGDEANVPVLVVVDTQNKVETNKENVESSFDTAEHIHYAARQQTHVTASSDLPIEAKVPSPPIVDDQTKVENVLDHIETCSYDTERIQQPTVCKRDTSKSDAMFGKQEDQPCTLVSNEEIQEEIPLGEASGSWETLSEYSCTSDEDQADDTRASPASPHHHHHHHQRRRRHRREPQWRPARAEEELEASPRGLYDLTLASPEVEVHLSEALAHSEAEQPLMPPGPRLSAVGAPGVPYAEALAAALAGVALVVDADAEAEGATDVLYGTRDLHNAAVEAAVACVVDSELRDLSTMYVQRLGGCLLVGGDQRPDADTQAPVTPEVDTCCGMDGESSPATTPVSELTTPPASPPGLESTSSSCSLHDGTLALAAAAGAVAACSLDGPRSNTIATLLTVCLFLAAYSGCLIIDPNLHLS